MVCGVSFSLPWGPEGPFRTVTFAKRDAMARHDRFVNTDGSTHAGLIGQAQHHPALRVNPPCFRASNELLGAIAEWLLALREKRSAEPMASSDRSHSHYALRKFLIISAQLGALIAINKAGYLVATGLHLPLPGNLVGM